MKFQDRISAFIALGKDLGRVQPDVLQKLAVSAQLENGWFTYDSVSLALQGLSVLLEEDRFQTWALSYSPEPRSIKTIGVAMAGNIPLVGFHDFMTVLLSGHRLLYKPSSKDTVLLDFIHQKLVAIEPRYAKFVTKNNLLKEIDALVATGGDNTYRYFEYYFRNIPHIIRKNRVSCAIIQGNESAAEIVLLGNDIFSYYGLGCRNVSTMFIPKQYDLVHILDQLKSFETVLDNRKYANNYLYQKSLAMINSESFLDTGYLLAKESEHIVSPVATLNYRRYDSRESLEEMISEYKEKIQAVVCHEGLIEGSVPFGKAQFPNVSEFADQVDTLKFLIDLK